MILENFISGKFVQQREYKSFSPEKINHEWIISNPELIGLLSDANRLLGELNAYSHLIPNVDFFILMHTIKEATLSSKIEGTNIDMKEALIKEEDINPEKKDDWHEVQNYIKAMNYSIKEMENLPISSRLIKETHKILLSGVRGGAKTPGEFRNSQNWIGATLKDAVYIPPHHSELPELLSDFDKFINNPSLEVPDLVKIAIIHYQFETIHPFQDGNGRIGRLLITLYLISSRILSKPSLYLSDFLEKNKGYYYDNLMIARVSNNLQQWIKFFLVGIIETSKESIDVFKKIIALREDIETNRLPKLGSKFENAQKLTMHLFKTPIIDTKDVEDVLGVSSATAGRLLKQMINLNILSELTGFKRNRKFMFGEYVNLFSRRN